ncbi:MAG: hypothetical protein JNK65_08625 [Deltaproteobacteria bacterium]|nr:hypothetical protein [Deltaproteobacteria bacterium]
MSPIQIQIRNLMPEINPAIIQNTLDSLKIPSPQASVVSFQSPALFVGEQFRTLLHQGRSPAVLMTPVQQFDWIPTQHLQMNLGLLTGLPLRGIELAQSHIQLPMEMAAGLPPLQRLFQWVMQNLKTQSLSTFTQIPTTGIHPSPVTPTAISNNPMIEDTNFAQSIEQQTQQRIYNPDPETQTKLNEVNSKRAKDGKAPIDFLKTTQEIERIMNDPNLSDKDKKDRIGKIRKDLGLSKGDMKKLFTKRLAKIYDEAKKQLELRIKNFENAVKQAEKTYGKDSPQALAAKQRLEMAKNLLGPKLEEYKGKSSLYGSMFPSGGFWSKLGGAFKKIGGFVKKVASGFTKIMDFATPFLKFIPGVGQMISAGWGAVKGIAQAIKGNWKGMLSSFIQGLPMVPGVGSFLSKMPSWIGKGIQLGKSIFNATQGKFTDLLSLGQNYLSQLSPFQWAEQKALPWFQNQMNKWIPFIKE